MRFVPALLTALSASALSVTVAGCGSSESTGSSSASELSADHVTTTEWNIIDAENQRDATGPALAQALASSDAATVNRALLALGRIGGPDVIPVIVSHFASATASVRAQAAFALSLVAGDSTRPELIPVVEQALTPRFPLEKDPAARAALYVALGHVGTVADLSFFEAGLAGATLESDMTARIGASQGAGVFFQAQAGAKPAITPSAALWATLYALASAPASASAAADQNAAGARALATFPGATESSVNALSTLMFQRVASGDKASARWLTTAIAHIASPTSLTALTKLFADTTVSPSVRAAAAADLSLQGSTAAVLALVTTALGDASPSVVQAALGAVTALGADAAPLSATLASLVTAKTSSDPAVASAALTALTALDPTTAAPFVAAELATPSSPYRDAAIYDAAFTDTAALLTLANSSDTHDALNALNAMTYLTSAQFTAAYGAGSITTLLDPLFKKALALHDEFAVDVVCWSASIFALTDMADACAAVYPYFTDQQYLSGRNGIIYAIDSLGAKDQLPLLQTMLHDPSRSVAVNAAAAIKDLTGTDVSAQASAQSAPTLVTPSVATINTATHSKVVLETTHGTITLQMLSSAPLTATAFAKAAADGMYDGLPFHRVIPNFIDQGGDPHKDGYGHFSYVLRDEPGPGGQQLGYVGLATTGKDTGSSQYFIDLGDNYWLDTSFSSFAVVTSGLDNAFAIQQGDIVTKAYVQ
jgi:cyclophilin family peptidyl-prolyl cis-trans isomerase/HEAT repeat protein